MTISERRDVEEDRDAGDARRGLQQAVDGRIGAEERRAIAVRQPVGQVDAEAGEQRVEVAAPRDRDRDVADRVLEDQVPADDPRDQLAERRVRVGVGAARPAESSTPAPRSRAPRAPQTTPSSRNEKHQRRAGAVADDLAGRQHLAGGGRADRREDAGADDRADRQHDQIAGAQDALQRLVALGAAARRSAFAANS